MTKKFVHVYEFCAFVRQNKKERAHKNKWENVSHKLQEKNLCGKKFPVCTSDLWTF